MYCQRKEHSHAFLIFLSVCALLLLLSNTVSTAQARVIEDMTGRKVEVPDKITKIFAASPPVMYLLYALDYKTLAGSNFSFTQREKKYLRQEVIDLPVIGGWFGQGQTPNFEHVMATQPDIMLSWFWTETAANQLVEEAVETIKLPNVYIRLETLEEYVRTFRFVGDLIGCPERGKALSEYTRKVLDDVHEALQVLPEDAKVSVYYAEGRDGLKTECDKSTHAALIGLSGGRNVVHCEQSSTYGMESVSIEEVLTKNPQVILVQDKRFAKNIYKNQQWSQIRAVKDKRVYVVPRGPFNWFDRPPSFMRVLGLQWLTNKLYPQRYPIDMVRATQDFYQLFMDVKLSKEEAQALLDQ